MDFAGASVRARGLRPCSGESGEHTYTMSETLHTRTHDPAIKCEMESVSRAAGNDCIMFQKFVSGTVNDAPRAQFLLMTLQLIVGEWTLVERHEMSASGHERAFALAHRSRDAPAA